MISDNPRDYGIPHDHWYPGQRDSFEWLVSQPMGTTVIEAPPGSGKTPFPVGLAKFHNRSVTALVKTKNLQTQNYRDIYGFDILMGKNNYPCELSPEMSVSECQYATAGKNPSLCPSRGDCEYWELQEQAKLSPLVCLNYALYLAWDWGRMINTGILVCDEADDLPRLITDWAGVDFGIKDRLEFDLPEYPLVRMNYPEYPTSDIDKIRIWLQLAASELGVRIPKDLASARRLEVLKREVATIRAAFAKSDLDHWYIKSTAGQMIIKPLTARHFFQSRFKAEFIVLMSATIGKDGEFISKALGLGNDFTFARIPNRWPPEQRPIYIPDDAPKMGINSPPADYDHQADLISKAILDRDHEWRGLVLVNSKAQAISLARRLSERGLQDRICVPPEYGGTEVQRAFWEEQKAKKVGPLLVTWGFHRGFDGTEERILVSAKVPFAPRGERDSFDAMRFKANPKMYQYEAANDLLQQVGRTRRGQPGDYGADNGLVMVADGNWPMLKKFLSDDFLGSIVSAN